MARIRDGMRTCRSRLRQMSEPFIERSSPTRGRDARRGPFRIFVGAHRFRHHPRRIERHQLVDARSDEVEAFLISQAGYGTHERPGRGEVRSGRRPRSARFAAAFPLGPRRRRHGTCSSAAGFQRVMSMPLRIPHVARAGAGCRETRTRAPGSDLRRVGRADSGDHSLN